MTHPSGCAVGWLVVLEDYALLPWKRSEKGSSQHLLPF
jgi:hypothetical protein